MKDYKGWIRLHRKMTDNPLWTCEKFTRGQAWIDLLLLANHTDNYFYLREHKIIVKRGQVGYSQLALSERWKWSRSKVKKFLNDLEKEQQIKQQISKSTSVITIVNYEIYQQKEQQDAQQQDNSKTTEKQQQDTNKNVKEGKESKESKEENVKVDYNKFVETWNPRCRNIPKIATMSDTRKAKLRAIAKEFGAEKTKYAMQNLFNSEFCQGQNNTNWVANVDWFLKRDNFIKCLENNYKNN
jgi:hypothetical protein